jgi:hypothetical protein
VSLLLSPDPWRLNHPSASLEAELKPLSELRQGSVAIAALDAGSLVRWQNQTDPGLQG